MPYIEKQGQRSYGIINRPRLVIVGAGEFAEIAYEYFTYDSPWEVVGFAVEADYYDRVQFCGLPVISLVDIVTRFPPDTHSAFVAVTYTKLNRVRGRLFETMREFGYSMASYISSRAFIWHTAKLGENVFVFENNVIQHGVEIEDDVVLWSGNHIGHRSRIKAHVYLSSHVVVSGYCTVGEYCFVGVNVTIADHVRVGRNCLVGAGVTLLRDAPDNALFQGTSGEASRISSLRFYRLQEDT